MKRVFFLNTLALVILFCYSCKKDTFVSGADARLFISTDSLKFDTVFTSIGSVTQVFKLFNENDQKLRLSSMRLGGGSGSAFKINVNGIAANQISNIDIAANDSIYVFVSVNINPSAANLPFLLSDSIVVDYNGSSQQVKLEAYGQNAVFLQNSVINANTTWTNNLPYVIIGGIRVAQGATLTIKEGTRIFSHSNAAFVVDGTLICDGTLSNKIIFSGDRLDLPYAKFPGSWPGIIFSLGSINNEFLFTDVRNASKAIVLQGPADNGNPKLILHQTSIDNAFESGLLCINSKLQADNCLISNCGTNINIRQGGSYRFINCTIASYSNDYILHKSAAVSIFNFSDTAGAISSSDLDALLRNCIVWGDNGSVDDEIVVGKQGLNIFNVIIDHCLYKAVNDPEVTNIAFSIKNLDPEFDSIDNRNNFYNFRTTKSISSPVLAAGVATNLLKDLDDNPRNTITPDIGCYEKQ